MTVALAGHRIKFAEASVLSKHPHSCIHIETDRYLDLRVPVSQLSNVDAAIKEAILGLINRYCTSLDGVLIAFSRLRLISPDVDLSEILGVFQDVRIYGTFAVFRPQPGKLLEGTVFRINPSNLGCMVHQNFTTSVKAEKASLNLNGLFSNNQQIVFKVVSVENRSNLCYIRGLLTKELIDFKKTGQPIPMEKALETLDTRKDRISDKHTRKKASSPFGLRTPDSGFLSEQTPSVSASVEPFTESDGASSDIFSSTKKERKRKRKESIDEPANVEMTDAVAEPSVRKKKKKKRVSEPEESVEDRFSALSVENETGSVQDAETSAAADPNEVHKSKKKKRKREHLDNPEPVTPVLPEFEAEDANSSAIGYGLSLKKSKHKKSKKFADESI